MKQVFSKSHLKEMKKCIVPLCMGLFLLDACAAGQADATKTPVDYVNPYTGNISHLLVPCYPTLSRPNGMMRLYPNRTDYTADLMYGLPVVVPSHRGGSPMAFSPTQASEADLKPVMAYSYDLEHLTPYHWSVYLDEAKIRVEFAPATQSAVYNFRFERDGDAKLILSGRDGEIKVGEDGSVEGCERLGNNGTRLYVYAVTDQPIKSSTFLGERQQGLALAFGNVKTLNLQYGISYISVEQAKRNLKREIGSFDVQPVADEGRRVWNETLGKIKVEGGREKDKTVFYTSLYRTYERMINISEDGKYWSAYDRTVHDDEGTPFYVDDWIWDTYRAVHPLRVLIEPEKERAMLRSYIRMAEQMPEKWLPTFPGVAGDGHAMNCNHAVAIFTDAYAKGLTDFDLEAAFKAGYAAIHEKSMLPFTFQPAMELDRFFHEHGYYPALADTEQETYPQVNPGEYRQPIPVTLGSSYDFWCLARMAKALGREDDYRYCMKRALDYRNLFNPQTGFFHPKNEQGEFLPDVDYGWSGGQGGRYYYDENNGWIYRWEVQHNFADLIALTGGAESFVKGLDDMFRTPLGRSKFEFYRKFPDHTGNIGQYSAGNEPCTHILYLYNYAGQPWKTQKRTRQVIDAYYRDDVMGVPGDEDGGGMTAFVAFTLLGFYPVTPGLPAYNIGSPVFTRSVIDLGNGKTFEVEAENASFDNKYIQSAMLNGVPWDKPWFSHSDLAGGGKLTLEMGPVANELWGSDPKQAPPSLEMVPTK
ncbi:MAG: glycoside hydrolase family 92 protein [Tannerella sp.]|jgi:predicted alpha-1,2-mannosidase|nr:glycoside hydrolase family 92 protein [Tannerella sp.]